MRPISVMAVDDEILALDYIEKLIAWEQTNYRLAAKATSAGEAVRLFQKLKPTIMLVDISMPDKNGINLMQEILDFGIPVKFIFLTAYREFQYVQEALRMGASGYVLKHDLQAETLLHELDRAVASLSMELKNRRSQEKRENGQTRQILPCVLCPDSVYPVLGGDFEIYAPPVEPIRCIDFSQYQAIDYVEILDAVKNKFFLGIYLKNVYRYSVISQELKMLGEELQQIFYEYTGFNASVAFAVTPCLQAQSQQIYQRLSDFVERRFFLGQGQILYLREEPTIPVGEQVSQKQIDELFSQIRKGEPGETILKNTFEKAKGSMSAFAMLVKMLVTGINWQRGELDMPSLYELDQMGAFNRELWRDFLGIYTWFSEQFQLLSKENLAHNQGQGSSKAGQAVLFIQRNYSRDLSVETIAEELGISGVYLIKIFKQETGKTVTEYLTEYRMEMAKKLILQRRWKIYDLAEQVGYHSAQYFSTVFKKYTGSTPQKYRSQNKSLLH